MSLKAELVSKLNDKVKEKSELDYYHEGIEDACVFTPNESEFADPLSYINQIRPIAEKYGICKIIPPKRWKPSFCIDMNTFKFTPRIQRLNELEAVARSKLNFLEKISKFWELQGQKFKIPILERKQVDLYKLNKLVETMGGYDYLVKNKRWLSLMKEMGFKENSSARSLRIHYERILYPFLLFQLGATLPAKNNSNIDDSINEEDQELGKKAKTTKSLSKKKSGVIDEEKIESIECLVCNRGDDEAFILLCDGCDDSYHTYCLYPPLQEIPKGDWRCPVCVSEICKKPTDSYGFEQSNKCYSLNDFGQMANKFKSQYFKKPHNNVSPEEVEKEFWRILSSPDESVVVEYGADLHTLETGSGFPTRTSKSTINNQEYLNSPWNLNNLSQLNKSVLSKMNVEISGMKIPWAYVGMCFSCFCWHVEDHWSYSINYLHWGETKTWYGISAAYAEKFEEVMKKNAPELFEKSPDLLHHLVTIMDPLLIKKSGVQIFKLNQNVGEFVITFPRAYHAGFNQGFNFAEAVNFCPADWMPIGRAAIENYKLFKRHTVFSHDELVFKIATNIDLNDIETINAIKSELFTIIDDERNQRRELFDKNLIKNENRVMFEFLTDDERTCDYCKTTFFVSAVKCSCAPEKFTCLNHYEHLCSSSNGTKKVNNHKLTLNYRYTLEEISSILEALNEFTSDYDDWSRQVEYLLDSSKIDKPHVSKLLELLETAKKKNYSISKSNTRKVSSYEKLEAEYNSAMQCSEFCRKVIELYRKSIISPKEEEVDEYDKEERKRKINESGSDDEVIFIKKSNKSEIKKRVTLDQLKLIGKNLNTLCCIIDEQTMIHSILSEALECDQKIDKLIDEWNIQTGTTNLNRILNYLDKIEIEFPFLKLQQLKVMKKQADWLGIVQRAVENPAELTINHLSSLIDKVVDDNLLITFNTKLNSKQLVQKTFVDLQELLSIAQTWDNKIKQQVESKSLLELNELEKTLTEVKCIPARLNNIGRLQKIVNDAHKWLENVDTFFTKEDSSRQSHLSSLIDAYTKSKNLPVKLRLMDAVQSKIELANDWILKLSKLFTYHPIHNNINKTNQMQCQLGTNNNNKIETIETTQLIQILTPRLDLKSIINKFQSAAAASSSSLSSSTPSTTETTKPSSAKRMKIKSLNNLSVHLEPNQQQELFLSCIEIATDLFTDKDKDFSILKEQFKSLELKELLFIKQLRDFNTEKLTALKSQYHVESSLDQISTTSKSLKTSGNNSAFNFKCSSCFKSINSSIQSNSVEQCRLCLGLFHLNNSCKSLISNKVALGIETKAASGSKHAAITISEYLKEEGIGIASAGMCLSCKRSRRPDLDQVLEKLIVYEKLELRSAEGDALQLFVNRVLNWQDKFKNVFDSTQIKDLLKLITTNKTTPISNKETISTQLLNDLKKAHSELNCLKKAELNELYLESLLLEVETDETRALNELFYFLNNSEENKLCFTKQFQSKSKKQGVESIDIKQENISDDSNDGTGIVNAVKEEKKSNKQIEKSNKLNKSAKMKINKQEGKSKAEKKKQSSSDEKSFKTAKSKKQKNATNNNAKEITGQDIYEIESDDDDDDNDESNDDEEEFCAASKCLQPTGDNIKWVQCDGYCDRWFHMMCIGLAKIKKKEKYLCNSCSEIKSKEQTKKRSNEEILFEVIEEENGTATSETQIQSQPPSTTTITNETKMEIDSSLIKDKTEIN